MKARVRILMLPSWYPTKDDPIAGSFFKEQALCLSKDFDFIVLTVEEHETPFRLQYLLRPPNFGAHLRLVESREGYSELVVRRERVKYRPKLLRILKFLGVQPSRRESALLSVWISSIQAELEQRYKFQPDLVYGMTAQINGALANQIARNLNTPLVLAEHNPFPLPGTLLSSETRNAIERCEALLVVSHDKARQVLMQNLLCQPMVIGNMVDQQIFSLAKKTTRTEKNLVVVAAYNFYKDLETLLKAIKRLRGLTKVRFRVTLVGFSPSTQLGAFNYGTQKFLALVDSFGLADFLTLVPMAERSSMPEIYHDADAFVMTSIQEGLPVSALEAAACGLPIFSTRCGGVEDFVDDSVGRLYNVRDHESLALGLCDFIEGRTTFEAEHIRNVVVSQYGAEAFRNRFGAIVDKVMAQKSELR